MILKRGEPGDCLSPDLEGGYAVGDPLVGLWEDIQDRLAQPRQRCSLRLRQSIEVLVDFLGRHDPILLIDELPQQGAQPWGMRCLRWPAPAERLRRSQSCPERSSLPAVSAGGCLHSVNAQNPFPSGRLAGILWLDYDASSEVIRRLEERGKEQQP